MAAQTQFLNKDQGLKFNLIQIWIGSFKDEASDSGLQSFSDKHWAMYLVFNPLKIQ